MACGIVADVTDDKATEDDRRTQTLHIEACNKKNSADACSFTGKHGLITSTCSMDTKSVLTCGTGPKSGKGKGRKGKGRRGKGSDGEWGGAKMIVNLFLFLLILFCVCLCYSTFKRRSNDEEEEATSVEMHASASRIQTVAPVAEGKPSSGSIVDSSIVKDIEMGPVTVAPCIDPVPEYQYVAGSMGSAPAYVYTRAV